ncbi:MAG: rhodanese-like domain-containing protein [Bacteroidales bacterium]|jgi:hydroxyacylglutathione hydrolase|nr:rhodanese-like domain-containing protein [Bacteroidales bacterium]
MNDLFNNKGFMSSGFRNLSPREAFAEATEGKAIIVDVREERLIGYKNFDVPRLIHLPKSRIEQDYVNLSGKQPLIIADSVGLRSHEVMELLIAKGFVNIANLAGGIVEWEQDGMPLKIDITEQLSGSCVCQLRPRNKI